LTDVVGSAVGVGVGSAGFETVNPFGLSKNVTSLTLRGNSL